MWTEGGGDLSPSSGGASRHLGSIFENPGAPGAPTTRPPASPWPGEDKGRKLRASPLPHSHPSSLSCLPQAPRADAQPERLRRKKKCCAARGAPGASWAVLGHLKAILSRIGYILGRLGGILGPS